ncbi:MAG: hypothetical protein PHN20_09870 [Bacteroidales bacterium]|nr:hypothetical protein [Bacteroidales bacterium]
MSEAVIKTVGEPHAVRLTTLQSPVGFKADGADLALIEVEVVDKDGQRCPTALNDIAFELRGEAVWIGGIAQGPDNCVGSKTLPVECGVNRVFIRSTTKAGKIHVAASAKGLKTARKQLETIPVTVTNGLRTDWVAEGLPSNLENGPTPLTPSFVPSRRTLPIRSAIAGAHPDKTGLSYDDNELSEWTNDGKLSTGWIAFQLEEASRMDAISLKMTNWRRASYPIDILIDGKRVWSGKTERSLGYILIPIEPTIGQTVTIQLTGAKTEEDAFQNMIELSGQKELDGFKIPENTDSKGQLRIVEVEILQKV